MKTDEIIHIKKKGRKKKEKWDTQNIKRETQSENCNKERSYEQKFFLHTYEMLITHLGTHINGDGPKKKKVGKLGIKI